MRQAERGGDLGGHAHRAVGAGREQAAGALAARQRLDRARVHRRDLLEAVGQARAHAERLGVEVACDRLDAEPPRRQIGAELAGARAQDDEGLRRNARAS